MEIARAVRAPARRGDPDHPDVGDDSSRDGGGEIPDIGGGGVPCRPDEGLDFPDIGTGGHAPEPPSPSHDDTAW